MVSINEWFAHFKACGGKPFLVGGYVVSRQFDKWSVGGPLGYRLIASLADLHGPDLSPFAR